MILVDLSGQVRERLQEWEQLAGKAGFGWGQEWTARDADQDDQEWSVVDAPGKRDMVGSEDQDVTALIATMDPAAVLALVVGLRAILDEHRIITPDTPYDDYAGDGCITCHYKGYGHVRGPGPCATVRALARAVGIPEEGGDDHG